MRTARSSRIPARTAWRAPRQLCETPGATRQRRSGDQANPRGRQVRQPLREDGSDREEQVRRRQERDPEKENAEPRRRAGPRERQRRHGREEQHRSDREHRGGRDRADGPGGLVRREPQGKQDPPQIPQQNQRSVPDAGDRREVRERVLDLEDARPARPQPAAEHPRPQGERAGQHEGAARVQGAAAPQRFAQARERSTLRKPEVAEKREGRRRRGALLGQKGERVEQEGDGKDESRGGVAFPEGARPQGGTGGRRARRASRPGRPGSQPPRRGSDARRRAARPQTPRRPGSAAFARAPRPRASPRRGGAG